MNPTAHDAPAASESANREPSAASVAPEPAQPPRSQGLRRPAPVQIAVWCLLAVAALLLAVFASLAVGVTKLGGTADAGRAQRDGLEGNRPDVPGHGDEDHDAI